MSRKKKSFRTGTNSDLQQFLNATFKRRKSSSCLHQWKYCKRRATSTGGGSPRNVCSNVKVTNEQLVKLYGDVSDTTKSLEFTQKELEDGTKVIKKDINWSRKGSLRPWGYYQ